MGDADCTYDFRKIKPFIEAYRGGHEYVMGSRWLGSIEKGAMPKLHQYFGTPFTTWILNRVYHAHFTDIHCGMRGITKDALIRMGLNSQSWEYASEMVLKSVRMELDTVEVPTTVGLSEGERCCDIPAGNARQISGLGCVVVTK